MNILKFLKDIVTFDNNDVNLENIILPNIENEVKFDIEIKTKFIDNRNGYFNNERSKLLYEIEKVTLKLNPLFLKDYFYHHRGIGYIIKFNFVENIIELIKPQSSPPVVCCEIKEKIFINCNILNDFVKMIKEDKNIIEEKLSREFIEYNKYAKEILSKVDSNLMYTIKI